MSLSKKPLAVAVMLFAAGGLGVSSTAWSASGSSELPNMVVSATGYQQEALRAPASITVVDHEQIQRKPVADLAEVLRDIPGVDIVDSGVAGMKRISLRGESSRRVLVKVNGQPIPDHSSYGSPLLLDVNMIERIEVVRGSASVVHGSNAIGGVVNITTRQSAPGEHEAFVGAGYYSATRGHRLNGGVLGATDTFDYNSKGDPERQRTSSYAELNIGAYYQPTQLPNLSLAVLAQNLANRRYRNPEELQAAGRALDMEIRWSF